MHTTTVDVHIWYFLLDQETPWYEVLSQEEQRRVARFVRARDARRFAVARSYMRRVLGGWLDLDPREVPIRYSTHGKPYLDDATLGEVQFNISHSDDLALFALAVGVEIGVDIERLQGARAHIDVARRFFTAREASTIEGAPYQCQAEAFLTCWTRKEAFVKGLGTGLSQPLHAFEVSGIPAEGAVLRATSEAPDLVLGWSLRDLSVPPHCVATLAVRHPEPRVVVRTAFQTDSKADPACGLAGRGSQEKT